MPTFILNDESKTNSYGFRVKNSGIDLTRFTANPVMLDQHWNSTDAVLGKWTKLRIEGTCLMADSDFDLEDDNAKKIAGKVDRGLIKGASMGISFDREAMMVGVDGKLELSQCELYEASIVAIPSNASALRLYAAPGQLLTEDEIKLTLSVFPSKSNNENFPSMKKMLLSLAALTVLGYKEQPNEDAQAQLSADIEKLGAELAAEKLARKTLQTNIDEAATLSATALVDDAVKSGRITADKRETFLWLAKSNPVQAKEILDAMPAKTSLAALVQPPAGAQLAAGRESWTYMDWAKKDSKGLAAMRANNPEEFAKLAAGPMKPAA